MIEAQIAKLEKQVKFISNVLSQMKIGGIPPIERVAVKNQVLPDLVNELYSIINGFYEAYDETGTAYFDVMQIQLESAYVTNDTIHKKDDFIKLFTDTFVEYLIENPQNYNDEFLSILKDHIMDGNLRIGISYEDDDTDDK